MAGITLFAWATPAFISGSPVDHTWVTTYDNRQHSYANAAAVAAAGKDYWFCWGSYHAAGGTPGNPTGALGSQAGNLALARCLVQSNADSRSAPAARGTIYVYGVDGVCHQLANQVLYATSGRKLTVNRARGYFASSFLYGTYGLQHAAWASKIAGCATTAAAAPGGGPSGASRGVLKMADLIDDFEEHARAVLGRDDPELLSRLLALRAEVNSYLAQKIPGVEPPDAETLNARNQHLLTEAARLLGAERFEQVFGFPAGEAINLVDPSLARGAPE
ncbi:hypothetical protein ABUE31_05870 [Mesorhizobium sp. ZMM04-5]|uniref:Uncharacterized protein n=1 Tax=Mesorhizobium marinum TaxID=3228790 RepID=A0ABV3QWR8_9HYPH